MPPHTPDDITVQLEWVRDNPRLFFSTPPRFDEVRAFLAGLDLATSWALLRDFDTWLVVRIGSGYEFHWTGLARYLAFGYDCDVNEPWPRDGSGFAAKFSDAEASMRLLNLAIDFLVANSSLPNRREMFRDFERLREADGLD